MLQLPESEYLFWLIGSNGVMRVCLEIVAILATFFLKLSNRRRAMLNITNNHDLSLYMRFRILCWTVWWSLQRWYRNKLTAFFNLHGWKFFTMQTFNNWDLTLAIFQKNYNTRASPHLAECRDEFSCICQIFYFVHCGL